MSNSRVETDTMGDVNLPEEALYGASTQRAIDNFAISSLRMPLEFVHAIALIKRAAAEANMELELLDESVGSRIRDAAREIEEGRHDEHFQIDVFQTGSATSTHMNVNEVIANLCSLKAGEAVGSKIPAHPNDHVNLGQSSNDVAPSALHISVVLGLSNRLVPALEALEDALAGKVCEWEDIIKVGRTHLMDATPLSLGEEFSGYQRQVEKAVKRCHRAIENLRELALGGTAVGTGVNAHEDFAELAIKIVRDKTGIDFREAKNHFEAQAARDDMVEVAGVLMAISASLIKISNDIRLLGSGPRAGFGELRLPALQPGSSIMPGKTNPVMCEMLVQACHYVTGHCQTIVRCGQEGQLELNATIPLIAHCAHQSISILASACEKFAEKCILDLEADGDRCREYAERSLMLVTKLTPEIGYE